MFSEELLQFLDTINACDRNDDTASFQFLQEKLHLDNLKASNYVLSFIRQEFKEVSHRLAPFTQLKKTVQAFRVKVSTLLYK